MDEDDKVEIGVNAHAEKGGTAIGNHSYAGRRGVAIGNGARAADGEVVITGGVNITGSYSSNFHERAPRQTKFEKPPKRANTNLNYQDVQICEICGNLLYLNKKKNIHTHENDTTCM